jgi:hypothetical protein
MPGHQVSGHTRCSNKIGSTSDFLFQFCELIMVELVWDARVPSHTSGVRHYPQGHPRVSDAARARCTISLQAQSW